MENNNSVDPTIFRLMTEQTRDYALLVLDPEGRIRTWNLGAQLIKGYYADEIIGSHFSKFYTADAVASGWPEHELKVASAEGRFEDEGWRVRKDGSRFWASVVITALRSESGELLGFSKITRDLSERKAYEETLRQSEERFRLLVGGVVDYAIYMLNREGIVTSWNAGAERIKGYTSEEIIGKHFSRFYRPEDVAAGKPWNELAQARQHGRAEDEGWRLKKNGEPFWARVVVTPLYDTAGHLRGFAKVTQDLTERRHMQDLEKAAQNIHEFIATLAHELRNPLAPIRSAAQVMAKLPVDDPRHAQMLAMVDRQSLHMAHIIDDLIDVTRIGRGILTVKDLPVDISEVIGRSLEATMPLAEARQHTVEVEWPETPLRIRGDPNRLTQLLTNLLSNAARYTPEGGRIRVIAKAGVGTEGDSAIVQVRDNGKGIEPDMIARIFDMFVQGRGTLERTEHGLGIGLALARKIAVLHGGTLEARSEGPGKGSEFTLRIPLASPGITDTTEPLQDVVQPASAKARRVLVVDDNTDAAESMSILLQSLGHTTCVVSDSALVLDTAIRFRPEVVLLDIGMPGIDGYEIAQRLRQLKIERPRIVALSGWGQESDRVKSRDAGFDMHLLKPVELDQLMAALGDGQAVV